MYCTIHKVFQMGINYLQYAGMKKFTPQMQNVLIEKIEVFKFEKIDV